MSIKLILDIYNYLIEIITQICLPTRNNTYVIIKLAVLKVNFIKYSGIINIFDDCKFFI